MANNIRRNKIGQITSTKPIETSISKSLIDSAKALDMKIKAMVRDELERELRLDIYDSYTPATKKGKAIKEYNKTHKHQKPHAYHHTGRLAQNIYALIDGNNVKAMVKDTQYRDGTSTTDVYNYLKFGTTDKPKKDAYSYNDGSNFSSYIPQSPHNFEARTREYMKSFLDKLEADIEQNGTKYIDKRYLKKLK